MNMKDSVLQNVRVAVGLDEDTSDYDVELLMHVNSAIGKLNQVGVGRFVVITDTTTTWEDVQDPNQTEGNKYFKMVPLFVAISTKLLFDPPPPSSAQYHSENADQILWRLKVAYEEPVVKDGVVDES